RIDRFLDELHPWDIARAIVEDVLGRHTHQPFRTRQVSNRLWALVKACSASDPKASALGIELHEQKPYRRVPDDVAEAPVHSVAVVVGPGNFVGRSHTDEAWYATFHGAVDALAPGGCEKEKVRCFDELPVGVGERAVHAVLLKPIRNSTPAIAILQLAVSFVIHAHRDPPSLAVSNDLVERPATLTVPRGKTRPTVVPGPFQRVV